MPEASANGNSVVTSGDLFQIVECTASFSEKNPL